MSTQKTNRLEHLLLLEIHYQSCAGADEMTELNIRFQMPAESLGIVKKLESSIRTTRFFRQLKKSAYFHALATDLETLYRSTTLVDDIV